MSFDPNTFLNTTVEGELDTKIIPCPVGEYNGISEKVDVKTWQSKDGSSSGLKVVVLWDIQDETVKQFVGRDKVLVPQDIMLDLTEEGGLDMGKGKNVGLGRLREALDMNRPGEPFAISNLQGRLALCSVTHRPGQSPEDVYAEIKRVAKPA